MVPSGHLEIVAKTLQTLGRASSQFRHKRLSEKLLTKLMTCISILGALEIPGELHGAALGGVGLYGLATQWFLDKNRQESLEAVFKKTM